MDMILPPVIGHQYNVLTACPWLVILWYWHCSLTATHERLMNHVEPLFKTSNDIEMSPKYSQTACTETHLPLPVTC